ncbi:MAG: hypothetical protein K2X90_03550 [Candidatus Babeliaceae bacterium]|nr:hypothetical protein [Candidatus Babeliaceae bacterium]
MFIIFITLIAASLAGVSSHLYRALMLQAQTVEYTIQAVQLEQYVQGVLAYALAQVAHSSNLQSQIDHEREAIVACDIFNNSYDGFIKGVVKYTSITGGCLIEAFILKSGQKVGGLRAKILRESTLKKVIYSCVSLEAF